MYQRQSLGTSSKVPWTERRTYETHAMTIDHTSFLTWLSKLAGKKIEKIECAPESVFVSKTRTDYRLFLTESFAMEKALMTLYLGDKLVAFALGDFVFFQEIRTGLYKKVNGGDVNYVLSEIINKGSVAVGEEIYTGRVHGSEIEAISKTVGTPIPIIERELF